MIPSQTLSVIKQYWEKGSIADIDWHTAVFLEECASAQKEEAALAGALLSWLSRQGHVAVPLDEWEGKKLFDDAEFETIGLPELRGSSNWRQKLKESGMLGEHLPLAERDGLVYFQKNLQYEHHIAQDVLARLETKPSLHITDDAIMSEVTELIARDSSGQNPNWQIVAVMMALSQCFTIITGGPGTGKTRTIVQFLEAFIRLCKDKKPRIALAAPTGKAAARMMESLLHTRGEGAHQISISEDIFQHFPTTATTLHRLLGSRYLSSQFRHNRENPLPYDVIIVDEASMIDVAMMAKLLEAVPRQSRLILLGDKDQLASVEAGAVLGDMCRPVSEHHDIAEFSDSPNSLLRMAGLNIPKMSKKATFSDAIVPLKHSWRFSKNPEIGTLAHAINQGDVTTVLQTLQMSDNPKLRLVPGMSQQTFLKELTDTIIARYDFSNQTSPAEKLQRIQTYQILCAHRRGKFGVGNITALIEKELRKRGVARQDLWYEGRPVMITENDYQSGLYNGDVGVTAENEKGELRVWFPIQGEMVPIIPNRLPAHQAAYAISVHKSQGSEFERVVLLLAEKKSPVMTRELLYTALTRSRSEFQVWGPEEVLRATIKDHIMRTSGLGKQLWQYEGNVSKFEKK